jgi:flagellar biosynthetic protein FliQ
MDGPMILDIGRDAVWLTIVIAGPVLVVGLVVGILVSMLQTVTQLQEPTLAYVPKILSIFAALILFFPYMGIQMASFMERLAKAIIAGN